jgi:hypothetical protein
VGRADRVALWIAGGILREQGVARTPAAMAALMPLAYRLADAALSAIGEFTAEIAAELAGETAAVGGVDMTEYEQEFSE